MRMEILTFLKSCVDTRAFLSTLSRSQKFGFDGKGVVLLECISLSSWAFVVAFHTLQFANATIAPCNANEDSILYTSWGHANYVSND